ncbi:hypothetical protein [Archangium sp.]|uniref:hypothetical protein n=1 Tax=Archangium sp. TaxID=1872627 RepID=UPI002D2A616A|nr:hypothetical protein [Archangium sp.]HYO55964.1 hypothetical protein [Archangium sp.]
MARRLALLTLLPLLLTAAVGCPHAWSRDGTIDQALERDMIEYHSMRECSLDVEDWIDFCKDYHQRGNKPEVQRLCPQECRPPPEHKP